VPGSAGHGPQASPPALSSPAPSTVSPRDEAQGPPATSTIDVIDKENTSFDSAVAIEIGPTYLSRFRNDDASLYFSFQRQPGSHDLNIIFTLVTADDAVKPAISIYDKKRTRLFTRWHESNDGNTIKWKPAVMSGDYIIEIKPNGASNSFARFFASTDSGMTNVPCSWLGWRVRLLY
jgi:hypothetical protein